MKSVRLVFQISVLSFQKNQYENFKIYINLQTNLVNLRLRLSTYVFLHFLNHSSYVNCHRQLQYTI